ncbi:MAG: M13 family metallopeptidase [Myxococcota bacterium]
MRTIPVILVLAACSGSRAPVVETPVPAPPPTGFEADVAAALDRKVDPCTDFYAFACGGWIAANPLPPDKPMVLRSFTTIGDQNELLLKAVLDEVAAAPGDDPNRQKLGAFWTSCLDEAAIDAKGIEPLAPTFARIDTLKDRKGFLALVGELGRQGLDGPFDIFVDADSKNPGLAIVQLMQGGTGLPDREDYLLEDRAEKRAQYLDHATKLLVLGGWSDADAAKAAADVLAFETKLAGLQWTPEQLRDSDKVYNKLDRAGLEKLAPHLDWAGFLAASGRPELTQINVMTPSFFEGFDKLVQSTDPATLRLYLKWRALNGSAAQLAKPLSDETFRFYGQILSGMQVQPDRWKRCVQRTDRALGDLLAAAYVDKAFPGDSKPIAVDMIGRIEAAFEAGLPSIAWMDADTRARAVEKARAITNKIGYPNHWREYTFEVKPDDYFGNNARAAAATSDYWLATAEKPIDPDTWMMTAPTVNAYYSATQNEIVFPAGILQPPFFSSTYPKAMNFGAMGMVMGHEITHGFDDEGRKFDAEGRLSEWWTPAAVEGFEKVAACVDTQYDGYEAAPGLHLSGELTLGENIADLGGLRISYRAYQQWVTENAPEPSVAGLTANQLFFVSHAQAWCSAASPEIMQMLVATDEHSPAKFRVNGPVSNLPEFAEAFQCAEGTPMRTANRCEVW